MSRTRTRDPSIAGGWHYRTPRHYRAYKLAAMVEDELGARGKVKKPPNAWDDIVISQWRGQEWFRRIQQKWRQSVPHVAAYDPVPVRLNDL